MSLGWIGFRGARPLRDTDTLEGRDRELSELCNRCESYDIVQITAPSGVGKTSFVMAGGKAALAERGFYVPPQRGWSDWLGDPRLRGHRDTPAEFAAALYRLLIGAPEAELARLDRPAADVLRSVAAGCATAGKMVVILDQLEELLRFQEAVGDELLRLAGEAANESHVPHVVIARSEYRDRLRPIEVRGAKVWNLYIQEITSRTAIEKIIRGPVEAAGVAIDDEAVDRIRTWWEKARDRRAGRAPGSGVDALGAVGLLHLQSLLWSFEQWAQTTDEFDRISTAALKAFALSRSVAAGRNFDPENDELAGAALIEDAIFIYVHDRIAQATIRPTVERAGEVRELDWTVGPRVMLSRVAPALSSGGYKVPQALSSMLPLALGDELSQRGARALADALRAGDDVGAYARDSRLTAAGLAADWHDQRRLLVELVDALESILQALTTDDANILRKFNLTDETVYELVHDGIGPALTRWSLAFVDQPISAIGLIAAQPGGAFRHDLSPATFADAGGALQPHWGAVTIERESGTPVAALDSLQWASNIVQATGWNASLHFENLVFRRCNFTGAAFVGCRFTNVTFDCCILKGAVMIGCSLDGVRVVPAPGAGPDVSLLTITRPAASSHVTFEGLDGTTGLFLEGLSGGEWNFTDCALSHLVVTAKPSAAETVLRFANVRGSHVTVDGPVVVKQDGNNEFSHSVGV